MALLSSPSLMAANLGSYRSTSFGKVLWDCYSHTWFLFFFLLTVLALTLAYFISVHIDLKFANIWV